MTEKQQSFFFFLYLSRGLEGPLTTLYDRKSHDAFIPCLREARMGSGNVDLSMSQVARPSKMKIKRLAVAKPWVGVFVGFCVLDGWQEGFLVWD